MKYKRLLILFYYFLFWIVFFELARLFFLIYNFQEIKNIALTEIISSFYHGFRLDLSVTSYILVPSTLLFIISAFFKNEKILKNLLNIFTAIVILVISLLVVSDAEVYRHWGFRLDVTPLLSLGNLSFITGNLSVLKLLFLILIYFVFCAISYYLYYSMVAINIKNIYSERFYSLLYLLITIFLFIPIRGGIGTVPINIGSAYYSTKTFCNHSAINVSWNFLNSILYNEIDYKKYEYFDNETAEKLFAQLQTKETTETSKIICESPDNIIFIILESFSADAIFCLGGENLTPNIDKWSKKGILFNNFYANTDRSDKALVAIFSSTPVLLNHSLMKIPEKSEKLPSITQKLIEKGYKTSFYYGGDINFANMSSYLRNIGFQDIYSKNNLKLDCISVPKWGYHDECMFDLFYNDIEKSTDKNVFALFTLSSHEPYEVPNIKKYSIRDEWNRARNSYIYTDSCLNIFLQKMYHSTKWHNSLIILVSDHSTLFPGDKEFWQKEKYRALMLWLGGSLQNETEGIVYQSLADDCDISKTLLGQLDYDIDVSDFIFSENLFAKQNTSTFFSFKDGFGFLKGNESYIYNVDANLEIQKISKNDSIEKLGKAYFQKLAGFYKSLE